MSPPYEVLQVPVQSRLIVTLSRTDGLIVTKPTVLHRQRAVRVSTPLPLAPVAVLWRVTTVGFRPPVSRRLISATYGRRCPSSSSEVPLLSLCGVSFSRNKASESRLPLPRRPRQTWLLPELPRRRLQNGPEGWVARAITVTPSCCPVLSCRHTRAIPFAPSSCLAVLSPQTLAFARHTPKAGTEDKYTQSFSPRTLEHVPKRYLRCCSSMPYPSVRFGALPVSPPMFFFLFSLLLISVARCCLPHYIYFLCLFASPL